MRNLKTVVDQILNEVDPHYEHKETLERRLNAVVQSYYYTAPEAMYLRWNEAAAILEQELGEPDTVWKKAISRIFSGVEK